ncbi:DUF4974 domain-containing protein [Crocinitomicaceae bacterium]|nr:DUF4974 domain-containing protein [Crocinitomicaceae bacterium]
MKTNKKEEIDQFPFQNVQVDYKKSKEDIWAEMEAKLSDLGEGKVTQEGRGRVISLSFIKYAAAIFLFLIGLVSFMKLYTVNEYLEAGLTKKIVLPDGSVVTLNGNSSLAYAPYWWRFDRKLEFEGEAFFSVKKGKRFKVVSESGSTQVLGTSFNIFATNSNYNVYCKTGKVKVENIHQEAQIITPGQAVFINSKGVMKTDSKINETECLAWMSHKFIFNTTPLEKVIADISRQYNVQIEISNRILKDKDFTGILDRKNSLDEVLKTICFSFDLKFIKNNTTHYQLTEK